MLYRNGFDLKTCLRMSPLKWDMSQPSEMFIAREIKHKSRWYQISRLLIISNSWNLIRHIVLLISRLPEIIEKRICTPDRVMDPTFQMNQSSSMFFSLRNSLIGVVFKITGFFSTPFKMTCDRRRPLMEDNLWRKMTFNERRPSIGCLVYYLENFFTTPHPDSHSTTDPKPEILSAV